MRIMHGSFDDFSLGEVVQVWSLSRQCLRWVIYRHDQRDSEFVLKSGQVIGARSTQGQRDAFRIYNHVKEHAIKGTGTRFEIFHITGLTQLPEPVTTLRALFHGESRQTKPQQQELLKETRRQDVAQAIAPTMDDLTQAHTRALRDIETQLTQVSTALQKQPTTRALWQRLDNHHETMIGIESLQRDTLRYAKSNAQRDNPAIDEVRDLCARTRRRVDDLHHQLKALEPRLATQAPGPSPMILGVLTTIVVFQAALFILFTLSLTQQ